MPLVQLALVPRLMVLWCLATVQARQSFAYQELFSCGNCYLPSGDLSRLGSMSFFDQITRP